ncbi:uncharacterized protein LOC143543541 [Bidens hawaiensis]|uniref:uncharacterized protein LOC143543541 n=1 Tax=Bidens hawaiensis TaxID=980011 RepID=UPI00404A99E7
MAEAFGVLATKKHPLSPLCSFITPRDISNVGLNLKTTANEVILNGAWAWPEVWRFKFPCLYASNPPLLTNEKKDSILWNCKDEKLLPFTTSEAFKVFSNNSPIKPRAKVIWFSQAIPRHAFFLWQATKERLPTQDRLYAWKVLAQDKYCALCNQQRDSHNHLFFECSYSRKV